MSQNHAGEHTGRRQILMLVDDLFFATRIETTARHLNIDVARSTGDASGASGGGNPAASGERPPDLIVVDLHSRRDPLAFIRNCKTSANEVPVVGFASHVEADLIRQAIEAGADLVLPRSAFTAKLPEILAGRLPGRSRAG